MKIIHLLQSPFFSGAENVVCQIMKIFSHEDDIHMIYVSPSGSIQESIESRGFIFLGIKTLTINNIRRIIKQEKPDIIHAHDISASLLACLSTVGTNVQIVSHVHVNNSNMAKLNIKTFLYYLSSFRYKHIFWVSSSCFDSYYFKKKLEKKSSILSNVTDKDDIIRRAQDNINSLKYDVIYVGRITYQKHPERLLEVISSVIKRIPSVKVGVVGDGAMLDQTKNLATKMGLLQNVDFLGFQSNPLGFLSKAKVMIMTSRYEGLPMTVLESLALGVPVVSTPVDGLIDVIESGKNGFLSDNNDEITNYICEIIQDNELRMKLSDYAKVKFDKICNLDTYKNTIKRVYLNND